MSKHIIILIAVAIVGFAVNENIVVTAQTNSTNSDKQKIVVTWLDTKTSDTPAISISDEDFGRLLTHFLNNQSMDLRIHLNNLTFFVMNDYHECIVVISGAFTIHSYAKS